MTPSSSKGSQARSNSEYADVLDMFRLLQEIPDGTPKFQRQRDSIVERCLPLADHIALIAPAGGEVGWLDHHPFAGLRGRGIQIMRAPSCRPCSKASACLRR